MDNVSDVVATFFDAFTSGPGLEQRMAALRAAFVPGAVIVRLLDGWPDVMDVEAFVAPREALLGGDRVTDFREWPTAWHLDQLGGLAHHWSRYAKSWSEGGVARTGSGAKSLQLLRTPDGWRITALTWDDDPTD